MHIIYSSNAASEIRIKQELPDTLHKILSPTPDTSRKLMNLINETELRHLI